MTVALIVLGVPAVLWLAFEVWRAPLCVSCAISSPHPCVQAMRHEQAAPP